MTITKMSRRAGTLPNVDKRGASAVHAIQSVFPSLLASVPRNWLRPQHSDLLRNMRCWSLLQLSFTGAPLLGRNYLPERRDGLRVSSRSIVYLDIFVWYVAHRCALPSCFIQWQSSLRGNLYFTDSKGPLRLPKFPRGNVTRLGSMGIHKPEASCYPYIPTGR